MLLFMVLWSSAAIATKFGILAAPPLTLAWSRFALAGIFLLTGLKISRSPWKPPAEWRSTLAILGLLNTTIYLGASFAALTVVPAGLFNLFVAANPFLVLILSRIWLGEPVRRGQWLGLGLAGTGLFIGSFSSLTKAVPIWGIGLVLGGMSAMAFGSVYYQKRQVNLPGILVNTWQLLWGALFLLPVAAVLGYNRPIHWNWDWWGSLIWLVGAVSIGAMLLWFRLLKRGAARASAWLMMTPVLGYVMAWAVLKEPLTIADGIASGLVVSGLYIAERAAKGLANSRSPATVPSNLREKPLGDKR